MLIPPRTKPVSEVYTTPLDYELIRARQLRDGVANAVAAAETAGTKPPDRAMEAADKLVAVIENAVTLARQQSYRKDERSERLVPAVQAALEALDQLHRGLLKLVVLEAEGEELPVAAVEEQAEALGRESR
jgi:hypothetical protein